MLDSGATVNAISADLLQKIGGTLNPTQERVRYANGQVGTPDRVAEIELRARGHMSRLQCLVINGLGSELLLGRPWLCEWNPTIDWVSGELQFSDGIKWKPTAPAKSREEQSLAGLHTPALRLGEKGKRRVWEALKPQTLEDEESDEEVEDAVP